MNEPGANRNDPMAERVGDGQAEDHPPTNDPTVHAPPVARPQACQQLTFES
jgi:hypothetical protein